ncbi:MAG: hypothetical protein P4L39_09415 [Humidesulfovibrio sp.]|nr:hypothetical protein [Humidesulfovibrio sp.]
MDSLFVAAACLLLGVLLRRLGRMPEDADRYDLRRIASGDLR